MKQREDLLKEWGLPPNASESDIRKPYRRLAKTCHPDVNSSSDAHQAFVRLQKVYNALTNKPNEATSHTAHTTQKQKKAEATFAAREASKAYSKRLRNTLWMMYTILDLPCYFLCISVLLALTDWLVPRQLAQVVVQDAIDYLAYVEDPSTGEGSLSYEYLQLKDGRTIVLDIGALPNIWQYEDRLIWIEESILFRHIKYVFPEDDSSNGLLAANYLYAMFWFLHFFNLLLTIQYIRSTANERFKIHFGILAVLMGMVQVIAWYQTMTL